MTATLTDVFGLTDRGRVRTENQDQFLIAEVGRSLIVRQSSSPGLATSSAVAVGPCQVFAVADGMGGHAAGKVASRVSIDALAESLGAALPQVVLDSRPVEARVGAALEAAIQACQHSLVEEADQSTRSMGTTMTAGCVVDSRLHLAHVGDSRCYLLRGGVVYRMTRDQTVAQKMVDRGELDASEVARSLMRNVLSQALTAREGEEPTPELRQEAIDRGDALLFCSDGLTRHVTETDLVRLHDLAPSAARACQNLVDAANQAGGEDNIAVIVARFGA